LKSKNLSLENLSVLIIGLKECEQIEVWATDNNNKKYERILSYNFCSSSGTLGPKSKQGDMQIPEGVYYIDRFNPSSNFYLSLGINYPTACDKARASGNPGGDIFIHGDCVTIGCIPITDDKIKELYTLCVLAKNAGQTKIPVYLFPFRMNEEDMLKQTKSKPYNFWKSLAPICEYLYEQKAMPKYTCSGDGQYVCTPQLIGGFKVSRWFEIHRFRCFAMCGCG